MSDHSLAFVPLSAGYHQSMDVLARGRAVDTGLLAESLIYYDRILLHVDNPVQFSQLISVLIQQGLSVADIAALFRDEVFGIFNFAFTTHPYVEFVSPESIKIHGLYNIQDPTMEQPDSFSKRSLSLRRSASALRTRRNLTNSLLHWMVVLLKSNRMRSA